MFPVHRFHWSVLTCFFFLLQILDLWSCKYRFCPSSGAYNHWTWQLLLLESARYRQTLVLIPNINELQIAALCLAFYLRLLWLDQSLPEFDHLQFCCFIFLSNGKERESWHVRRRFSIIQKLILQCNVEDTPRVDYKYYHKELESCYALQIKRSWCPEFT